MSDFTTYGYRDDTPMTKILDRLYLGGFGNAEALADYNPHNITHILNCTEEPLKTLDPIKVAILQLGQQDGCDWDPAKVEQALAWLHRSLALGCTVLVHCHAGISRSPTMIAAYLHTCGFNFEDAILQVKALRSQVQPAPAIWISMKHILKLGALD